MNIDILLGKKELQEPPVIKCEIRDCFNCTKSDKERSECEDRINMINYLKQYFGEVQFSSALHMGVIETVMKNFNEVSEKINGLRKEIINNGTT